MAQQELLRKRVITPEAVLSYPHVFEPQQFEDGPPKYSTALVFPEGTDLSEMKKAALEVGRSRWKDFADGVRRGRYHWPFRDDPADVAEKGYPEGSTFLNASSKKRPGVVSIIPDPATGKPMVVDDPERVYPGVFARASVTFFTFEVKGNRGVGVGLNNLQIIRDGPRLDGRVDPTDEFEADPDAVPDLSDLEEGEEDTAESTADISDLLD